MLVVTATDPSPAATLRTEDVFSVRVRFHTATPFHLRVLGQSQGATVAGRTHASPRYGPGTGEAIAWVSYHQPTHLDRIFLAAVDASNGRVLAQAALPVQLTWSDDPSAPHLDPAPWVSNLDNAAQRAVAAELQPQHQATPGYESYLLLMLSTLGFPIYLIIQLSLPWYLRGRWRKAGWAPACIAIPLMVVSYTFHPKWPPANWLLLLFPLLCLYLLTLLFIQRMKRSRP